ncbi:hypothetical protein [Haloplanus natans]|uniref:hypothetical protein n=1 Tax=Haloplanus natans TaxID=376171 RepID=UPI0012F7C163|nr:hypothetical protein [Haloplanus natans]
MTLSVNRIVVALLVTLSVATAGAPVAAQSGEQPAWADELFADLQDMQPRFNANVTDAEMNFAERQVFNQITGNVVNVYFVDTGVVFSFYMRPDGTITDLRQSRRDDASLKMLLTRETAENLVDLDDPVPQFVEHVRNGRRTGDTVEGIVINGEDGKPIKQATWTVINTVKGLF